MLTTSRKQQTSEAKAAAWNSYLDTCRAVRDLNGHGLAGYELKRYVEAERWAWSRLIDELKAA